LHEIPEPLSLEHDRALVGTFEELHEHERIAVAQVRFGGNALARRGENERRRHTEVLDAVRERRPPFSPEQVYAEFAELLKSYKVFQIRGDRYAGEWPRKQFRKHGVTYEPSERNKSEIYAAVLPLLNSGRVRLLDGDAKTIAQFAALERRTSRVGRDSIDHPPGVHDDRANAVSGVLSLQGAGVSLRVRSLDLDLSAGDGPRAAFHRSRRAAFAGKPDRTLSEESLLSKRGNRHEARISIV